MGTGRVRLREFWECFEREGGGGGFFWGGGGRRGSLRRAEFLY